METEEINEIGDCSLSESFLGAEDLISLRKSADESTRHVIGEKFYIRSDNLSEAEALECSMANLKSTLNQKRAARVCDLMHAEWNDELNVSMTKKLKGKFVQHMGHNIHGEIALSPEESMFLLENGCIEITNGETPLSTQEAFAVMLKGKLGPEKYQVYSHLSQLGFIVVPHQTELAVTRYEKRMNLDKHQLKKRKGPPVLPEEPKRKRLTFTGALSGEPEVDPLLDDSQISSGEPETDTVLDDSRSQDNSVENDTTEIISTFETKINENGVLLSALESKICDSVTTVTSIEMVKESEANPSNVDVMSNTQNEQTDTSAKEEFNSEVNSVLNTETGKPDISETIVTSSGDHENEKVDFQIADAGTSSDRNLISNSNDLRKDNDVEMDQQIKEVEVTNEMNVQNHIDESVSSRELKTSGEPESNVQPVVMNSQSTPADLSSKSDIDVMDVDSQNTDISCNVSETSRDAFYRNINVSSSTASQDSCCAVVDNSTDNGDANTNSNFDIMSCSSNNSQEGDVLSLDADSGDSMVRDVYEDDDVTLIEVTKKETKPLAIIDLLSEDDEADAESEPSGSDDEISVLKVCSAPSGSNGTLSKESSSRKLYNCKKEERSSPVRNPKFLTPSLSVHFPDLFRKDVVCVARPPLNLLPSHVKPSKEAYILDLKQKNDQQPTSERRVWDSYRQMQEYQRTRRQNRHSGQSFSEFQGCDMRRWADRNPRPYDSSFRQGHSNGLLNSLDRTSNPNSNNYGHPRDMRMASFNAPPNYTQSQPNYPIPNTTLMNSVVSIRQQNMSMVGNHSFPPIIPGFSPNIPIPNTANLGPAQIMSEVHRTAYSYARNMLSYMLNQNGNIHPSAINPFPICPPSMNGHGSGPLSNSYPLQRSNTAFLRNCNPEPMLSERWNYRDQQRRHHTGRPFPCHYRGIGSKQSWDEIKAAVRGNESSVSDNSDIEEVPISLTEVLWDSNSVNPLLKPGVRHTKSFVLDSLHSSQMAKLNKCNLNERCFQDASSLEISFDVYLPGSNYKKTFPDIPKHRIIVVKSTDPIPRFAELAFLQRKWNDGALLQIAFVDNGDVSFVSFNSISLPGMVPHEK